MKLYLRNDEGVAMKFVGIRRVENAGQILKWKYIKSKFEFVCEKPINKRMLICIACGNGSFEYRIELSKTRRQRLC